jgi:hypothetical protein
VSGPSRAVLDASDKVAQASVVGVILLLKSTAFNKTVFFEIFHGKV